MRAPVAAVRWKTASAKALAEAALSMDSLERAKNFLP